MKAFIKYALLYGSISLFAPTPARKSGRINLLFYVILASHMLFLGISVLSNVDALLHNSLVKLASSHNLSVHLSYIISFVADSITDNVIRVATLVYWKDIIGLVATVNGIKANIRFRDQHWKSKSFLVWTVILTICGFVRMVEILINNNAQSKIRNMDFHYLPSSPIILNTICLLLDISSTFSFSNIFLFVGFMGMIFIAWFKDLVERFERHFFSCKDELVLRAEVSTLAKGSILDKILDTDSQSKEYEQMVTEFLEFREAFEKYIKIGGVYCFCIIFNCTLVLIQFFGNALSRESKKESEFTQLLYIWSIVFVTTLGNYLNQSVNFFKRRLQDRQVQALTRPDERVSRFISCLTDWKWELTAMDLFSINYSLVPGVAATVLTYCIFLFQLKTSETIPRAN